MRRVTALLAVATVVGVLATGAGAEVPPGGTFADDDGNIHEGNIEAIAAIGVTLGCNPLGTLYCPADPVTRGQMASFLARAFDLPATANDFFSDDAGSIHEDNINRIAGAQITLGFADGTYRPDALVTREQMGSFIARAMGLTPVPGNRFLDVAGSPHEADINAIADAGVTLGCNPVGPLYCPKSVVLRDQMASFIARAMGLQPLVPPPPQAWTTLDSSPGVGADTSVVLGPGGFPVVAYLDETNRDAKIAICPDSRCSTPSIAVLDSGNVGTVGDVVIGTDGLPLISYTRTDATGSELYAAHCENATCTQVTRSNLTGSGVGASAVPPSTALGADGRPIIAFIESTYLVIAHCSNVACTSATITAVEPINAFSPPDIAVGSDGLPIVAYYDRDDFRLKTVHCDDVICSGGVIRLVGPISPVNGQSPSITIGGAGFPLIAHHAWQIQDLDLMVTACRDVICGDVKTITKTSPDNIGAYSSIATGPDGFAQVVYRDTTNNRLMYFKCLNAECTSKTVDSVLDTSGGSHCSLTVSLGGTAFAAYRGGSAGELRLLSVGP